MTRYRIAAVLALALATAGCSMGLPQHAATLENIQAMRAAGIPNVGVGTFALAPGLPEGMDRSIGIRAVSVSSPDGSFSTYLRQTLITELTAGGKLDPASPIVIGGQLTESRIDAGLAEANAVLGANFTVTRDGKTVFSKAFEVHDAWKGDFLGAVAIPAAMDHYTALYSRLVGALLADGEFRAAVGQRS
jgi:hypothetical protein